MLARRVGLAVGSEDPMKLSPEFLVVVALIATLPCSPAWGTIITLSGNLDAAQVVGINLTPLPVKPLRP